MITPVELQGKTFKTGRGYDKKDVDTFLKELLTDFETLYKENIELNEKITSLEEKVNYYQTIEKTLQKALVLAEKSAEETKQNAIEKSNLIVEEAQLKASSIIQEAKDEYSNIHKKSINLLQQYEVYKAQFSQLAKTQCELLESDAFKIQVANLPSFTFEEDMEETSNSSDLSAEEEQAKVEQATDHSVDMEEDKSTTVEEEKGDIEFFNLGDDE